MYDGLAIINDENVVTYVNDRVCQISGFNRDELIGGSVIDLLEQYSNAFNLRDFGGRMSKRKEDDRTPYELEFVRKDGRMITIMISPQAIFSTDGQFIGSFAVVTDITEHKKAEKELIKIKARLEYLLTSAPTIIYSCEPKGDNQITFMSSNVRDILGHKPEDFVGDPTFWENGLLPEEKETVITAYHKFAKNHNKNFYSYVNRFKHKNGTYRWMLEEAKLIQDEKGNHVEIIGSWTDITERKQAQDALREIEKKYRDLISNLTDIVIEIDSEGNFIYISPQVYDTFGYKPEEALGLNGFDFIHPDDFESAAKYFEKVLDGEQVYSVEYRAKHKDGHFFPVSVTGRMVREEDE